MANAALDDHAPEDIVCKHDVFDIDFHPSQDVLALGMITGAVQVYKYSEDKNVKVLDLKHHQEACRALAFAPDGQTLYTASADKSIRSFDVNGNPSWAELRAHDHPVNKLLQISNNVIASGDDQGCIKIWDTRQHNCIVEWKEHVDFISDMTLHPAGGHLVATGGDGRLSVYDLRKNVLAGKSDELDDELLSVSVIKNGKKIVCGSQDGVLVIFSWGTFGDMSDRFPGHPESVETVLKVDEDTILTGSSDGIIRVVQIHPNKLLGLIGDHEEFPVEVLKFSHNKRIIGSVSHVNKVHFWDVGYLYDEDEDEEQINEKDIPQLCMTSGREEKMEVDVSDSDDEDDSDDVSDDDDSEMMGNRGNSGGIHGRKTMPTEREAFFSDL